MFWKMEDLHVLTSRQHVLEQEYIIVCMYVSTLFQEGDTWQ
jgi:hypothetical protein